MEKALTLKEVAEILGMHYMTIYEKRHQIAFRLPGSRAWRVWPSKLDELTKPRNNLIRLALRVENGENLCQSEKANQKTGGSIFARQAANELDNLLAQVTSEKRKSTTIK